MSLRKATTKFLEIFPEGFADPKYLENERNYKVEAHQPMQTLLGVEAFEELLKHEDYEEICAKALKVANKANLIFSNEKMALKDGLLLGTV